MAKNRNILVCPLNWGLGHATRCVPIINNHLYQGDNVIIAADGAALAFLQLEFPDLHFIRMKGFSMYYLPGVWLPFGLMFQMPLFLTNIYIENIRIKKVIKKFDIETIIADNRYGIRNKKVKSVLITHQLFIQLPIYIKWLQRPLHKLTFQLIRKFDEVWIPDYESTTEGLSGKLSHGSGLKNKIIFIGPLSRFKGFEIPVKLNIEIPDILILLSGPGRQKQKLTDKLIRILKNKPVKVLLVGGKPQNPYYFDHLNIKQINHLTTLEFAYLIKNCPKIIARAGYSTIMDLHILGRNAILIPTPGQWEQEYLAENPILQQKFLFIDERNILSQDLIDNNSNL
jgi:uncharacterized protein (TIGR00661 family)